MHNPESNIANLCIVYPKHRESPISKRHPSRIHTRDLVIKTTPLALVNFSYVLSLLEDQPKLIQPVNGPHVI